MHTSLFIAFHCFAYGSCFDVEEIKWINFSQKIMQPCINILDDNLHNLFEIVVDIVFCKLIFPM